MDNMRIIWGTDHKVGTTMLAQSYAEKLAEKNENILLLTLSSDPGDAFYAEKAMSIEECRNRLSCGLLTKENIREYAIKGKSFFKLNGLSHPRNMFEFTPSMAGDLIRISSEAFDEVVIDCGTGLDSPLTLAALSFGRKNIFVFSQQESSVRSWQRSSDEISALGIVPDIAVINKFFKGDNNTPGHIAQRTGLSQNIFRTVVESEFGLQAEADRKTILYYGDKQFEKDIKALMN